jgi:hypothetical protein
MERQTITNDTVFISATEPVLYDGCDFQLYWAVADSVSWRRSACSPSFPTDFALCDGRGPVRFLRGPLGTEGNGEVRSLGPPDLLATYPLASVASRARKGSEGPPTNAALEATMSLHQFEYGVSDLIQATALIDDGIIALKDGGLLAGWRYTGADFTPEMAPMIRTA